MIVENIIQTVIEEVEYSLNHCDPDRDSEHYEVQVTRKDEGATGRGYGGIIVATVKTDSFPQATSIHSALTTVALLSKTRDHVSIESVS